MKTQFHQAFLAVWAVQVVWVSPCRPFACTQQKQFPNKLGKPGVKVLRLKKG